MSRSGALIGIFVILGGAVAALPARAQKDAKQEVRVVDSRDPIGVQSYVLHVLGGGREPEKIEKTDAEGRTAIAPSRCSALGLRAAPEDSRYYISPIVFCGAAHYPLLLQVQSRYKETVPTVVGGTSAPPTSTKTSASQASPGSATAPQGPGTKPPK